MLGDVLRRRLDAGRPGEPTLTATVFNPSLPPYPEFCPRVGWLLWRRIFFNKDAQHKMLRPAPAQCELPDNASVTKATTLQTSDDNVKEMK